MPRRKKLDVSSVLEAFLDEIDARVGRALAESVRELHRRIDRLERNLSGRGKEGAVQSFKVCRKPGCNSRVVAHGLCSRHYQQWRYHLRKTEATEPVETPVASASAPRKAPVKVPRKAQPTSGKSASPRQRPRPQRPAKNPPAAG